MNDLPKIAVLSVCSLAIGFAAFPSAVANHYSYGTGDSGCNALNAPEANSTQYYFYDELQSESSAAVTWNRTNNINPTNMSTADHQEINASTDVVVFDRYYVDYCGADWDGGPSDPDGGVVGKGNCYRVVATGTRCDRHDLRLNNNFTDYAAQSWIRGLACHEAGHTLGLGHRPDSANGTCMPQGYPKPMNKYDNHDITQGIAFN